MKQSCLITSRLTLRPFILEDAKRLQQLAGDKKISDFTANIPHPYPEGLAEEWIMRQSTLYERGEGISFAIEPTATRIFIGCISLMDVENFQAELGYWVGVEFWNKGYCSEACAEVLSFAGRVIGLNRLIARHLSKNPASGKVLLKSGFTHTGTTHGQCGIHKHAEDIENYAIILSE